MSETETRNRGISIFLAAGAPDRSSTRPTDEQWEKIKFSQEFMTSANEVKKLVPDAAGMSLTFIFWKPNFPLPRHSHNVDCLYYIISGSAILGRRTLSAGDSFFVPTDAPYQYTAGPEGVEVLEIRRDKESWDMNIREDPERYAEKARAAVEANRELWLHTTPPTFEAVSSRERSGVEATA
jgi:mannose-6-phosphate isomerase-like protein (cupin superfamily)